MQKPTVVIGLLGPVLDMGKRENRWGRWRPTVSLCQQRPGLCVNRFELLYQRRYAALMKRIVNDIKTISPETEVAPHEVHMADPWDFEEVYGVLHDFAVAYPFDPEAADYLVHITTGTHVAQICLFLLTESRYFPARLLQTGPAPKENDAPADPAGRYSIIDLDLSRYDRIAMRFHKTRVDDISFLKSGIDTRNPAFNALIARIEQVAGRSGAPMLITGPTGAGKSFLTRRIYELKKARRQLAGPFVEVNCATLRGDMALSTLFGHRKGAFTGAMADREGMLARANGGLLFLDEIGELGADEQSLLLRAIEEKRFPPMGSDREVESDFKLICGTNRDLSAEAAAGRFRADLLSRIDLWTFRLPPLRERPEDIAPNLDYELEKYAGRHGARVTFNREARERFLAFAVSPEAAWSANFRDLNGAVTRMATLCDGGRITVGGVEEEIGRLRHRWRHGAGDASAGRAGHAEGILEKILGPTAVAGLDPFDHAQLALALTEVRDCGSLSAAGRRLFAVSRLAKKRPNDADRLRKYLEKFGIDWRGVAAGRHFPDPPKNAIVPEPLK